MKKLALNTRYLCLFLGIPALLWPLLYLCRPLWYVPRCAVVPSPCVFDAVNSFDRISFQFNSVRADFLSNVVQNSVAVIAISLIWIYFKKRPLRAFQESFFLLGATLWNGAALELTRSFVQRPRPLVYSAPMLDGAKISQYTSFFSGHTSFVATAMLSLALIARRDHTPTHPTTRICIGLLFFYFVLSALTGSLRIYGGRHFPTDVICGFIAGSLVAWFWNQIWERKVLSMKH